MRILHFLSAPFYLNFWKTVMSHAPFQYFTEYKSMFHKIGKSSFMVIMQKSWFYDLK